MELTVTIEVTALLKVLLDSVPQFAGIVIVPGAATEALRPAPVTDCTDTVTVEPSLKTLVEPALPLREIATRADFDVAVAQLTAPKLMFWLATGVRPSPSEIVLSAYATAAHARALSANATTRPSLPRLEAFVDPFISPLPQLSRRGERRLPQGINHRCAHQRSSFSTQPYTQSTATARAATDGRTMTANGHERDCPKV